MPEKMKQRKGPIKCEFDLRDESFVYSFEDKDGATVVEVDYTLLLNNPYSRTYKNQWMMNVGFLWLAMSTAGRIYEHFTHISLGVTPFGLLGGIVVLWAYYSRVNVSAFSLENGFIVHVIKDKQHDKIVNELLERRNRILLGRYGVINAAESRDHEISKFHWLKSEGVIGPDELDSKLAEIDAIYGVEELKSDTLH